MPLINGLVDWGSWWVTRRLGGHLLAKLEHRASPAAIFGWSIGHGVLDLALAAAMLLAMAAALAFGFESYSQLAIFRDGEAAFDLTAHVAEAAASPFGAGAWLTLMLLTTLVPTFLHLVVVLMSPLGLLLPSAKRTEWAITLDDWDGADEPTRSRTRRAVANWLARGRIGLWLLAGVLAVILFAGLSTIIAAVHQGGFAGYVEAAAMQGIDLAKAIGHMLGATPAP